MPPSCLSPSGEPAREPEQRGLRSSCLQGPPQKGSRAGLLGPSGLSWGHPPGLGTSKKLIRPREKHSVITLIPPLACLLPGSACRRYSHRHCTGCRDLPRVTQLAKTDAGYYVTTLPTRYSSHWPTLFPVPCSEPGIQEALNSSFISFSSASWLRPWQSGQRAEGRGHSGRPYSGTCGYNSARVMQAVSLHGLQPTSAGCPHLRQVYQANLWTYHLPTHPFIVHTN